jgi:hypothetical protein
MQKLMVDIIREIETKNQKEILEIKSLVITEEYL